MKCKTLAVVIAALSMAGCGNYTPQQISTIKRKCVVIGGNSSISVNTKSGNVNVWCTIDGIAYKYHSVTGKFYLVDIVDG